MTDKNKTEIVVVLDRSGSMMSVQNDMIGGFNSFVSQQSLLPGECRLSLYQFDHEYETVYVSKRIGDVPPLTLVPRGNTALLDAVGRTIAATGERLEALPEPERPGVVVFLIITDGYENASSEYNYGRVHELVERQKTKYNWQFVYLGSDLSTKAEASRIGTKSVSYAATAEGVRGVYGCVGQSVGVLRSAVANGAVSAQLDLGDAAKREEP